ncbi:hypothetical protein COU61_03615 [Candidatus Pacearchaeota archaeon CG10_big_fil_rev_8_21_14_0_10_35_13]|nr:MAG: hypothetical protein COU61_03615 [Candidatus Pacearchaeota archaeon CG10_big_fil_rev_8_21_14_0_10_35_13]
MAGYNTRLEALRIYEDGNFRGAVDRVLGNPLPELIDPGACASRSRVHDYVREQLMTGQVTPRELFLKDLGRHD